ncbi:MAG: rplV [Candidatus Taylorbacteria bacterium]|nr:rplV [Candidatus Taylorbacteria bacterium]
MKATLQTYRQSPRKVRLLADLIRGKKIPEALNNLAFADKRAGPIFAKLLKSAVANATNNDSAKAEDLFVKEVSVNQGVTMKRMMPRARGSGARINKRTSHLSITLGVKELASPKGKKAEVAETKESKPKVVKKTAKAKKA